MSAKLVLRVEWNEAVRICRDPFDTKKFLACSRLSVSENDRKSERATSGISCERDPGVKRRGLQTKHFHWSSRCSCLGNCLVWKLNMREKTPTLHGWTQMVVYKYSAANDPQAENDPQIGPQMIPNRKWSPIRTANDPAGKRGKAWSLVSWISLFFYFLLYFCILFFFIN